MDTFYLQLQVYIVMLLGLIIALLSVYIISHKVDSTDFGKSLFVSWLFGIVAFAGNIIFTFGGAYNILALPYGLIAICFAYFFIRGLNQYLRISVNNYWNLVVALFILFQVGSFLISNERRLIYLPGMLFVAVVMFVACITILRQNKFNCFLNYSFAGVCFLLGLSVVANNFIPLSPVMYAVTSAVLAVSDITIFIISLILIGYGRTIFHGFSGLYTIFDNYSHMVIVYDINDDEYFLVNKCAKSFFGLPDRCTKKEINNSLLVQILRRDISDDNTGKGQRIFNLNVNEKNYWLDILYAYETIDGRRLEVIVANDITSKKEKEQKDIANLEYFSTIFKITPIPFIILNGNGTEVLDVNKATCDALKYTPEEMRSKQFDIRYDLFVASKDYIKVVQKIKIASFLLNSECEFITRDRNIITVMLSGVVISLSNEKLMFLTFNDITELKRSNDAVEKFNSELEQKVYERTEQLNDMLGSLQREVMIKEKTKHELEAHQASLLTLNKELDRNRQELKKTNEHLERLVSERTADLNDALKVKEIILNNLGHELRTPLNGALGFISLLTQELTDLQQLDDLNCVEISLKRLERTLNSLVMITEIENKSSKINLDILPLNILVANYFSTLKVVFPDCRAEFRFEEKAKDTYAYIDQTSMDSVLYYIINNAVKFTDQGSITISVDKVISNDKQWGVIRIVDTGYGIKDEDMNKIFMPFRQGDEGLSRNAEGLGVGLFISRKLMTMMGGNITINSCVGVGTEVSLFFAGAPDNYIAEVEQEEDKK